MHEGTGVVVKEDIVKRGILCKARMESDGGKEERRTGRKVTWCMESTMEEER